MVAWSLHPRPPATIAVVTLLGDRGTRRHTSSMTDVFAQVSGTGVGVGVQYDVRYGCLRAPPVFCVGCACRQLLPPTPEGETASGWLLLGSGVRGAQPWRQAGGPPAAGEAEALLVEVQRLQTYIDRLEGQVKDRPLQDLLQAEVCGG